MIARLSRLDDKIAVEHSKSIALECDDCKPFRYVDVTLEVRGGVGDGVLTETWDGNGRGL